MSKYIKKLLQFGRKIITLILGKQKTNQIICCVSRFLLNYHKKIQFDEQYEVKKFSIDKKNCFFGYYDLQSLNADNSKLLSHVTVSMDQNKNDCDIGYFNITTGEFVKLYTTHAWNTQQGSRLQWFDNDSVIFNDFENNEYCCKILNLKNNSIQVLKQALYDITIDRNFGVFCNFEVLNYYRPGYGYSKKANFEITAAENGVWLFNIEKNQSKKLISIEDIKKYKFNETETDKHYINHLKFSPSGEKILFFHLWTDCKTNNLKCRAIIINLDGKIVNVLSDFDKCSHYTWKNDKNIFLTIVKQNKTEYRMYNLEKGSFVKENFLNCDGHPSFLNKNEYITDTYPDKTGMQHLYLCKYGIKKYELLSIYHSPELIDEVRCDLHPRITKLGINIDCVPKLFREQYLIKKASVVSAKQNSFDVYHTLTGCFVRNSLQVIKLKLVSIAFSDALALNSYLLSKNKYLKNILWNRFTRKNDSFIGRNVLIGRNFHIMHFSGVFIGDGVKIGNNCTLYHQVTIGKDEGCYPVLKDNVTVFAGAKIFGDVVIGNNVIIGANSVVTKDIPDNTIVAGIPAKILGTY